MLVPGIHVVERTALGLATVLARKGKSGQLAARVRDHFGIELPYEQRCAISGDVAFAGTAPGAWLATRKNTSADFALSLSESLAGLASVSEQSDGFAVLRVSGMKVRETLCKLVPIDVHPRAFTINQVAVTVAAHMPVTMWREADDADGAAVFEIATFQSFAETFRHALSQSAAQFATLR